jgi:DNA-binding XRE family transcriptional regulator
MADLNLRSLHPLSVARRRALMTQTELAEHAGICQAGVSHIESGALLKRGGAALACASVLGVDLAEVLSGPQLALLGKLEDRDLVGVWTGEKSRELRELLDAEGVA